LMASHLAPTFNETLPSLLQVIQCINPHIYIRLDYLTVRVYNFDLISTVRLTLKIVHPCDMPTPSSVDRTGIPLHCPQIRLEQGAGYDVSTTAWREFPARCILFSLLFMWITAPPEMEATSMSLKVSSGSGHLELRIYLHCRQFFALHSVCL
jgi:hypothetical protein